MKLHETMRATMSPDVYDGPNCDQHLPQWIGSAEGDMDGDGPVGVDGALSLSAHTFPPGTVVTVQEPRCPECDEIPSPGQSGNWECGCAFDWHEWASEEFS